MMRRSHLQPPLIHPCCNTFLSEPLPPHTPPTTNAPLPHPPAANPRFNERELEWVRDDTWTYTREFKVDAWKGGELVLAGVDTVADISLNGKGLGRIANEFRNHRVALDAGDLITSDKGVNKLSITIFPAKIEAEKAQTSYPYAVPSIAHVDSFAGHKGFIRKAGADFGW